ncbi:MAG: hypothetical protein OEZ55_10995, partial [Nitrospinota bacterium]|nr:hypothetical protein [Nitrospinota bacterium]
MRPKVVGAIGKKTMLGGAPESIRRNILGGIGCPSVPVAQVLKERKISASLEPAHLHAGVASVQDSVIVGQHAVSLVLRFGGGEYKAVESSIGPRRNSQH